jgi:hypothetical protein
LNYQDNAIGAGINVSKKQPKTTTQWLVIKI